MTLQARLYLIALLCFWVFALIGVAIVRRPRVLWDVRAQAWRARAVTAARIFTLSGRTRPLLAGYAVALLAFTAAHLDVWVPLMLLLSQVASQSVVEWFKLLYRRVRPEYWLVRQDRGHSYPSGHATTAIVSYVGWAVVIANSALPASVKWALCVLFAAWAGGICWSRLALGAHYFSDVFGGALFGAAWLCAMTAAAGNLFLRT